MAAVHFTTILCEPNTANRHIESHIFCEIRPCTNNSVCARFEAFRTFLCVFMSVFRVFVRYELWANVPVAIFFITVDSVVAQDCPAVLNKRNLWAPFSCPSNL